MRFLQSWAACSLVLAGLATASDVYDMKQDEFKDFVTKNELTMVEFFAPWCGHCKALAPEYESAATTLKEKNIPLVKVDCVANDELCKQYGIEAYPAVKIFRGPDNLKSYPGARKADAIVSYMIKQQLPAVSVLTADSLEAFKTADKVVMVGYFSSDDKASNESYNKVAEALRDTYLFGATSDAALAKAEGVKQPAIVLYKTYDEGKNDYDGSFDVEAVTEFARTAATPLVGEVNPETYGNYMRSGVPLAYIFSDTPEERKKFAEDFRPIAQKYKGKVNFATLDAKAFGAHAQNLNLPVGTWPAFAIQDTVKNTKFPFEGQDLTYAKISAFTDDFVDGKLEPSIRSEDVPETQEVPVLKVVAKNYDDIVLDANKDVFIEFYAPWCSHCKAMAPQFERLAELFANDSEFKDKITIAKCDATKNDVPDEVQGFPLIKLYAAGNKENPAVYRGSRTVEDMANFVRDNGKYKMDLWAKVGEKESEEDEEEDDDVEMQDVISAAADTVVKAAPAATEAASSASSVAVETSSSVSSAATDASSSASSVAKEASSTATSVATDVSSKVDEAASTVSSGASSVSSAASSAGSGVVDAVKSVVSEVADAAVTMIMDSDDGGIAEHDEL